MADMGPYDMYEEDLFSMEEFPGTTDFPKAEDKKSTMFRPTLGINSKISKIAFSNKDDIITDVPDCYRWK